MAIRIAQLLVGIAADTKQLKKSLADSQKQFRNFSRTITGSLGTLGISLGFQQIFRTVSATVDEVDRLTKATRNLGIAVKDIGTIELLSARSSVDIRQSTNLIQRQARRIAEAQQGGGEGINALRELGFTGDALERLNRMDPVNQLRQIADAMANLTNQADKLRIGMKLWDSEGVRPGLELIAQGAEGIDAAAEAARRLGLSLTPEDTKEMERFATAWAELGLQGTAAKREIVISIAPKATRTLEWLRSRENPITEMFRRGFQGETRFFGSALRFLIPQANTLPIQPSEQIPRQGGMSRAANEMLENAAQARADANVRADAVLRAAIIRGSQTAISSAAAGITGAMRGLSQGALAIGQVQNMVRGRAMNADILAQRFAAIGNTAVRRFVGTNPAILGSTPAGFTALRANFRMRESSTEKRDEKRNEILNQILGQIRALAGDVGNARAF